MFIRKYKTENYLKFTDSKKNQNPNFNVEGVKCPKFQRHAKTGNGIPQRKSNATERKFEGNPRKFKNENLNRIINRDD